MPKVQTLVSLIQQEGWSAIPLAGQALGFYPPAALFDKLWLDSSWAFPGATNRVNMRVFALRRSGHHAILNWIRYQLPDRYCFLNECQVGKNPFTSCSRANSLVKHWAGEHRYLNWKQEQRGCWAKKGILIHNYEDGDFRDYLQQATPNQEQAWIGSSARHLSILILRDPFNLFASKFRWARGKTLTPDFSHLQTLPQLWKVYAKEFLNQTHFLEEKVNISYNDWLVDQSYRDQIASQIGFKNQDLGLDEVAKWGPTTWGDSFDGLKFDGQARQMKVLERWRQYQDDPLFRSLFQDAELWELSRSIFGVIPGAEALLKPLPLSEE